MLLRNKITAPTLMRGVYSFVDPRQIWPDLTFSKIVALIVKEGQIRLEVDKDIFCS